jgi:hypothetical protein
MHPDDEDYLPTVITWATVVSPAVARAATAPIDPEQLARLLEECR